MPNPMIELTPELREALTRVYEDGQQNWDRGEGFPPSEETNALYKLVRPLTKYGPPKPPTNDEILQLAARRGEYVIPPGSITGLIDGWERALQELLAPDAYRILCATLFLYQRPK